MCGHVWCVHVFVSVCASREYAVPIAVPGVALDLAGCITCDSHPGITETLPGRFVLKTVPVRPNLGPSWAKRQISQYGTKHLFIALIMLKLLAKKSEKIY